MLATLVAEPVYEEKVDGWRILAFKDGGGVRLLSRHGVDHTERFPRGGARRETFNDRYWSASREPQRSMTSRGYDPRQSPGPGYKRVVSCKGSSHGTDVLAVSEHGAPGRRPNIHAHFVGRQSEDGLDTLPARAAEANRSTLIADIPFPAPENVAAKRCASEKRAF